MLSKFGNLTIREILVVASAYVPRPPVQTLGEGEGKPRKGNPSGSRGGWRMPSFRGGKSRGASGQPVYSLAGNKTKEQQENFIYIKKNQCITNTDYLQIAKLIEAGSMETYHLHFYNTNT